MLEINYNICKDALYSVIRGVNYMMYSIVTFLTNDTLVSNIQADDKFSGIIDAIKATALTLCVLFFIMDFFSKTFHLQWVTWENVMMLFLKLFAAKVLVENSVWITDCIYQGLAEMTADVTGTTASGLFITELIPVSEIGWEKAALYLVSESERDLIFGDAGGGFMSLQPVILNMRIWATGLIMQIVMLVANVIVLARIFELIVYTLIAPVPLSTFACEGLSDVGKGFLKSYAAVVIQALVLIIMFVVYGSLATFLLELETSDGSLLIMDTGFGGLIMTFTLATGITQSGQWAKRICGAA